MSGFLQDEGRRLVAEMLAGSGRKVDGMYVEWAVSSALETSRGPSSRCTREYFSKLSGRKDAGYVRVRVFNAYVDDGMAVHYNTMLMRDDFPKSRSRLYVTGVTLVSLGRTPSDDVLVFSSDFDKPVAVSDGVYTTVHSSIRLGAAEKK